MNAEGWYRDPYLRHDARWYSAGKPTALVMDDGSVSRDPIPDGPISAINNMPALTGVDPVTGTAAAGGGVLAVNTMGFMGGQQLYFGTVASPPEFHC